LNTRDESIDLAPFVLGSEYTRPQIAEQGGVTVPTSIFETNWSQGVVEFSNAVLLFVTLEKDGEYAYQDYFDGDMFWWQSQNRQSRKTDLIIRMGTGAIPVYLFVRLRAKDGSTTRPFVYCGRLSSREMEGDKPVDCLFDVLDFDESADGALAEVYAWRPAGTPPPGAAERRASMARKRGGQGFQLDKELRLALERYAMDRARAHYEAAGYAVQDTSANRPYDLVCTRGDELRRVEIKGTSTAGEKVILTSGEVSAAREVGTVTDLYVVRNVRVSSTGAGRQLSGGDTHLIANWVPADDDLETKQYIYRLPT